MGSFETPINLEFDSTQTSIGVEPLAKKRHRNYDATRTWQDSYVIQFAWAKSKMVDNMLVSIKHTMCEIITSWVKHIMFK